MNINIDSSGLSILSCPRKYWLTCIKGVPSPQNEYSNFGSAFHKVIEDLSPFVPNVPNEKLLERVIINAAHYKISNPSRLMAACQTALNFCERWNAPVALEHRFSREFYPGVFLQGTMDRWDIVNDYAVITDWKTVSNPTKNINVYNSKLQLRFYMWNAITNPDAFPEVLRPYLRAGKVYGQFAGIYYTLTPVRIDLSEPLFATLTMLQEVAAMVETAASSISELAEQTDLPLPYGMLDGHQCEYCQFKTLCKLPDTSARQAILKQHLEVTKPYEPLHFRD